MTPRRFPPPWYAEDNGACFIVKDASSLAVAYVYYELKPGRRTASNNLMTRDEARRTIGGRECSVGADLDGKRKSSRVRLFAPRTIWPRRSPKRKEDMVDEVGWMSRVREMIICSQ
jgi:hypothetical protein